MRVSAALLTWVLTLAIMSPSLPWTIGECTGDCGSSSDAGPVLLQVVGLEVYLAVPAAILTAILVSLLSLRTADAHEAAVRAALGEAASFVRRRALRRGLTDGLIVGVSAYVIAGVTHLALERSLGWDPFSTDPGAWTTRAVEAVMAALVLVAAHVIAVRRPGMSPVARLREDVEAARPPRAWWPLAVAAGTWALAVAVVLVLASAVEAPAPGAVQAVADIAYAVAWAAVVGSVLVGLLPWARVQAPRVLAWAAGLTDAMGAPRLAALLAARASSPRKATGRVVTVLGALAFAYVALTSTSFGGSDDRLAVTISIEDVASADVEAQLRGIEGVDHVVVAPSFTGFDPWLTLAAVDLSAPGEVDPSIVAALEEHPGAVVTSSDGDLTTFTTPGFTPTAVVKVPEAAANYVTLDSLADLVNGTTFMVYAEDDASVDQVTRLAERVAWGESSWSSIGYADTPGPMGAWITGIAVLAAVFAPVAIGAVSAGARDAAVLAALGGEARLVRRALVIEGAVLASFALAVGGAAGAITRIVMTVVDAAADSLGGVITASSLSAALTAVPWAGALIAGAVSLLAFTAVTAVAAAAWRLETPAEAIREGAAR